jgi:hypothetical protein
MSTKGNSLTIIIIEKTAQMKTINVKDYKEEELFKKCGFKKDTDFKKQTEWLIKYDNKKYVISLYGKLEGKSGMENKYDFPPPIDNKLFFGACALVGQLKDETNKKTLINLSIPLWDKLYEKLFGGFKDLNNIEEGEYDDDNEIETNVKKSKKVVKKIVSDDDLEGSEAGDSEYSDYDSENDSDDNENSKDINGYNDEQLVIPDISTELCEEEYDYDN